MYICTYLIIVTIKSDSVVVICKWARYIIQSYRLITEAFLTFDHEQKKLGLVINSNKSKYMTTDKNCNNWPNFK